MSSDQRFCLTDNVTSFADDDEDEDREDRRMQDRSDDNDCGRWSPADCDTDQEIGSSLRPPVGYTGGKWKPGHGPVDLYSGYRILDSSLEEGTTTRAEDPVTEKIRRICLSLRNGLLDRKSLLLEERKCLQEFPFLCRVCPFFSTQMSSFTWHLNSSQHNERTADVFVRITCHMCSFSCHRIEDLIQHFNHERKKGKTGTRRSANLIESQFMRGTVFSCETPITKFSCSLCQRQFRLRVAHRIHFRTHQPQPKSRTSDRQAVGQSVPEDGVTAERVEDRLICPMCSSRHSTKGNLHQHMKRHAPPESRAFKCPSCVRTFAVRADLVKHSAVHSISQSFKCDECPHSAKSLQSLRKHQKVHRSEKPFKCADCMFSCKLSSNLTRHRRVHSGEKPYSCPHCEYRTGNQENLRKHVLGSKKHRGLPVYCCDCCSFGSNDFSLMTQHMRREHERTNIRSIFQLRDAA